MQTEVCKFCNSNREIFLKLYHAISFKDTLEKYFIQHCEMETSIFSFSQNVFVCHGKVQHLMFISPIPQSMVLRILGKSAFENIVSSVMEETLLERQHKTINRVFSLGFIHLLNFK